MVPDTLASYDTLCAKHHSVFVLLGKLLKDILKLFSAKKLGGLCAEALKYLVCVVVMVTAVASAAALLIVMVMLMLVAMTLLVMVVMLMLVAMALLVMVVVLMLVAMTLLVMVVVLMLMAMALLIVVVLVLMAMALLVMMVMLVLVAMALLIVVVMVMMVAVLLLELGDSIVKSILALDSRKNSHTVKLIPGGSYDDRLGIMLTDKLYRLLDLMLLGAVGVRKNDCGSVCYLIVIKLTEVLHIHFNLVDIGNGGIAVEHNILGVNALDRLCNIGKLADTRGLDKHAVGMEALKHLGKSLGKITDKRAADTARVHLGYFDACILKETAVDANLAKLVLDKHDPFALISLGDKLLYKRGLARSQKS